MENTYVIILVVLAIGVAAGFFLGKYIVNKKAAKEKTIILSHEHEKIVFRVIKIISAANYFIGTWYDENPAECRIFMISDTEFNQLKISELKEDRAYFIARDESHQVTFFPFDESCISIHSRNGTIDAVHASKNFSLKKGEEISLCSVVLNPKREDFFYIPKTLEYFLP